MDGANTRASTDNATIEDVSDPLLETLNSVLRLSNRPTLAQQNAERPRRFSDTDRGTTTTAPVLRPEPIAVRSRDGSRWLPAPDEQSHRYGGKASISDGLDPASGPSLKPHICHATECAVSKVFATPELLELVLSYLDTRNVLEVRLTSPRWDTVVRTSPELRLHLFCLPQFARLGSDFQLLPLCMPGLDVKLGEPLHLGQWVHVSMTARAARYILPNSSPTRRVRSRSIYEGLRGGLGSRSSNTKADWPTSSSGLPAKGLLRYEGLLIGQPPPINMQAFIVSHDDTKSFSAKGKEVERLDDRPFPCAKLHCDAGISLGFLAETVQSILTDSKLKSGEVKVLFKTIVSFCNTDSAPRKRSGTRGVTMIG
ncbi:hypothetical protein BAUCODRAFT_337878 [Baudoinia panamericana UAMH 10762]|uniref:F-box domain-containing protein n=1 Tax=Baudoinia panamericana (strain UAMH 10762) TaxID=717646 RepID=M2N623_BAUPA|nr:uncharacterized protein BAUCODRAFT_337878 [Baudoinia panamericana UAMH 10762]EMC99478.1 hypothetical protein BAUCODRAFT_337878 [Baudoinia panamericana UAMH 10762]